VSAYVRAEATPSPEAYPDGTNGTLSLAERRDPLRSTSTLIPWDPVPPDNSSAASADPTSGSTIDTPDLGSLLTELVSLPGWADGNSMSFLIDPFDSYSPAATDSREVYGSAAGIDQVPVLTYTFTEAPNPDLTTTTVVASSHVDEVTDQNTAGVSRNTGNALSELFYAGNTNEPRQLALRFDNIAIPVGAVIKTAYLTLSTAATTDIPAAATDWQYVDGTGSGVDPTSTPDPLDPTTDTTSTTSDTVSINLRAELSDSPDDYTLGTLGTRDYTTTFVNWDNVPATESTEVVSPNISSLVSAVTGLADWASGDSLSLRLTAPEGHVNSATNLRRILTSTSTEKPQLLITWEPGSTTGSGASATQTTAIRFSQVHVPPGAQIKSARIIFHSAEANDEATTLEITGEHSASPRALQAVNNDLGGRSKTTARESWAVESWSTIGTAYPTPDLSRIVQEITDIPEWCGGNAMTFFLSGTGKRIAVSADANPIKAPTLEITYAPDSVPSGAYCSNSSIVVPLADAQDDAVQNDATDSVDVLGQSLSTDSVGDGTGDSQTIGLRFRGVNLPRDATIVSATLQLTSTTDITEASKFNISIERSDDAPGFSAADNDINARSWSNTVRWSSNPPVAANEGTFTSDLKSLIETIVGRSGWERGNSMAFRLESLTTSVPHAFSSADASEAQAPRLIIYFESERENPGTRFRDNLKRHVNELVAQGGTPITSSLYEAALYFRGGEIDYGKRRGARRSEDRFHRVSHPFSYEGGELYQPKGCIDSNLDSDKCIWETINNNSSNPTYLSPLESQCQTNHIVLLSDGAATSNTAVSRIQNLTGTTCDTSYGNSETCGRELIDWLHTSDHSPALPGTQNITTHTIAFNLAEGERGFLADLAAAGGGGAYTADSAASLLAAFKNIFINVSKTDTSFVAPSVTLNQQNRMKNSDELYFAMFKPESTARWNGNLKKYKLKGATDADPIIVDRDGLPAVDESTGEFKAGARSFWSNAVDGGSVLLGGAAARIEGNGYSHEYRKVYTY
ncbi:MAG: hypothetical protein HKN42_01175, partial [Granulosicoccus sp.]|nr:hypothetical protein [Granulosicoccus sp.]